MASLQNFGRFGVSITPKAAIPMTIIRKRLKARNKRKNQLYRAVDRARALAERFNPFTAEGRANIIHGGF